MCTARKGVKDLPISAQGLPAVRRAGLPAVIMEGLPAVRRAGLPAVIFTRRPSGGLVRRFYGGVADWRAVLGKSGCWERNAHQSLSVMPVEPHGQALQKHGG